MSIQVTAVICTRNRAAFLQKCIHSLLAQTAPSEQYEILVVDNGSTDTTQQIIESFGNVENLRSVFEPVAGLSRARNTGLQHARGLWVGYIDDDATADPIWVASVLAAVARQKWPAIWLGGPIHLDWEVAGPDWIEGDLLVPLGYIDWGTEARVLSPHERLGGGNSVYDRQRLIAIGGFDERLGRNATSLLSGEETQLQKRVEAAGDSLYYHPGIKIYHFVGKERVRPVWFYRRYYWGGVSDFFMARTLAIQRSTTIRSVEKPDDNNKYATVGRLVRNLIRASGVMSDRKATIHARIYLAYVWGWFTGIVRWYICSPKCK